MSRPSSARRLGMLLPLLLGAAYLMVPVNHVQAQGCIEYTVWNEQTQRCECPDQWCCEFYYPFIPYGCEEGEAMAEELPISSPVLKWLQYQPQAKGDEFFLIAK